MAKYLTLKIYWTGLASEKAIDRTNDLEIGIMVKFLTRIYKRKF